MKNITKIALLLFVSVVFIRPAIADDFPWPAFLPSMIKRVPPAPEPEPEPTFTCANHPVALCSIWTENMTGYEEVGRKILPDCTVEFYEFGMRYYTGTWEPVSETTVLLHNRSRDILGTYIDSNNYRESNLMYSCGSRF